MVEPMDFTLRFTITGWVIVFGALALIAVVVAMIRKVDNHWQKREAKEEAAAVEKEPTIDNLTLVLITAACATMIQGRYHIRHVRRLLPSDMASRSPWSLQGRAILHGSHVVSRKR